jgi:hypothetical protein
MYFLKTYPTPSKAMYRNVAGMKAGNEAKQTAAVSSERNGKNYFKKNKKRVPNRPCYFPEQ